MSRLTPKYLMNFIVFILLLLSPVFSVMYAQDTGRPKVLVLPLTTDLDRKTADAFQWDISGALNESGKFDLVNKNDYQNALKTFKIDERNPVIPDSLIPVMMDSVHAQIYTKGTLDQAGGKGNPMKAKVDYIFPKNDFIIEGKEFSVENENRSRELASKVAEVIILASDKISFMAIARSYFNSAIYNKAIEYYTKLLEIEPGNILGHYMIATSYLKMDSVDKAITLYNKMLQERDSTHIPTRDILAKTYYGRKDYENALLQYRKLLQQNPDSYEYNQYLAYSLYQLNRTDEALEAFHRMVAIKDEDPSVRMQLGGMYLTKVSKLEEAGDSSSTQGQAAKAVVEFKRALELLEADKSTEEKRKLDCQNYLAASYRKAGQKNEAIQTLAKLVNVRPDYPNAYYTMAVYANELEKFDDAVRYFQESLKYQPESSLYAIYQNIGLIYRSKKKDNPKAIEAFTNAMKTAPATSKPTLYLLRGLSYHDIGNSLDYSDNDKADMESLIEEGKMTLSRADQALDLYGKAASDLALVTGQYSKNAQQYITRIGELKTRVEQIKKKIEYNERTK